MGTMRTTKRVVKRDCDMCKAIGLKTKALYDDATHLGPWAYMCEEHHKEHGRGIGFILRQEDS